MMSRVIQVGFKDHRFNIVTTEDQRDWYMTLKEAAEVYGVAETTVFHHLSNHPEEFVEDYDKGMQPLQTPGGPQKVVILYKVGVIKLGFHIHNPRAVAFRNYAAQLAINDLDKGGVTKANFGTFLDTREDIDDIMNYATGRVLKGDEKP